MPLWLLVQVGGLYHEVGRLARTDALTGVANRRAWDDELPRELARADQALYAAKEGGRNRSRACPPAAAVVGDLRGDSDRWHRQEGNRT